MPGYITLKQKYEEAIDACHIARDLKSDYIFTHWLLFLNYAKMGEGVKAATELQAIVRTSIPTSQYEDEIMDAFTASGIEGIFAWLIDLNMNKPVRTAGLSGQPFLFRGGTPLWAIGKIRFSGWKGIWKPSTEGVLVFRSDCTKSGF